MSRYRITRFLIALFGSLALSAPALAGKPLFVGQGNAQGNAVGAVDTLSERPGTVSVTVLQADASVVASSTKEIELDLGTRRVNAVLEKAQTTPTGSLVWSGQLSGAKTRPLTRNETGRDELNSVILVRRGNGITGSVHADGKLFRIQPLPDGNHALIEVDASRLPQDHPASYYTKEHAAHDAANSAVEPAAALADTTIRVMVYATPQAISAYSGDMQALTELAVAESNSGYSNSAIGINMVLAGYHVATGYTESTNWDTNVSRWVGKTDGFIDGAHAQRNTDAADVNVLLFNQSAYCGEASAIGATEATAFAVVYWDCATGYYSFAHEIGHLQGARHDPANDSTSTPYAFGHGYQYIPASGTSWRTVMAYNCTPSCTRINYWSSPSITYGGVAMGTAATNDNARVLRTTKATVAAFRPDPGGNVAPTANYTFTTSGLTANFADSSSDSDGTIASRSWNFGDSSTSTTTNPSHAYASAGTYTVSLTVTDNGGASNAVSKSVTVTAANNAPTANFTYSVSGLTANFIDGSSDSDGTIASRSWNFGDSTTSTATSPSHAYAAGGSYNVTLTVTDNGGKTGTVTKSVVINAPPPNVLQKGVIVSGLAATQGNSINYTMVVPSGATNLTFTMSGGTGDADMYVNFGSAPTDSVYSCRPYKTGNAETCTYAAPSAGTYYIRLKAFSSFTGVSLVGDYTLSNTQTYTNSTAKPIPDVSTITSTVSVSGRTGNAPSNAQVSVNITHTYRGDLKIDLVAPDGSVYNLKASSTSDGAANVIATYPVNLSSELLNGTWTLRVQDVASSDTGTLNNWSITF